MCYHPITIPNKSRHLDLNSSAVQYTVPCGHCAQCRSDKIHNYQLRAYYEYQETLKHHGFVYFETLTYDEDHHPYITLPNPWTGGNDAYKCFRPHDFTNFQKLLRKRLSDFGLTPIGRNQLNRQVNNTWSYLMTSEYGSDPTKTHRAHYHVIYFVKSNKITPKEFRDLIEDLWTNYYKFGITDQKNKADYTQGIKTDMQAISYICKYVTKPQNWYDHIYSVVESKRKALEEFRDNLLVEFDFERDPVKSLQINELTDALEKYDTEINKLKPVHRQSIGFGISALEHELNKDALLRPDAQMAFVSAKGKLIHVPMPQYFKRKVWQYCEKYEDKDGQTRYQWRLTDKAKELIFADLEDSIDRQLDRYNNIYNNSNLYTQYHSIACGCKQPDLAGLIDQLLESRPLVDFVIYKMFYQNRLINASYKWTNAWKRYYTPDGRLHVVKGEIAHSPTTALCSYEEIQANHLQLDGCTAQLIDNPIKEDPSKIKHFKSLRCTQDSYLCFNGFDTLDTVITAYVQSLNEYKENLEDEKYYLERLIKQLKQNETVQT